MFYHSLSIALVIAGLTMAEFRTESEANDWIDLYDTLAAKIYNKRALSLWAYYTNLTDHNKQEYARIVQEVASFDKQARDNASHWDWRNFKDQRTKRIFRKVANIDENILSPEKLKQHTSLSAELQELYSKGEVCGRPSDSNKTICYQLEPGLTDVFERSRDWTDLVWAWRGWRDATGRKMTNQFEKMVELKNEIARKHGYRNKADSVNQKYEVTDLRGICESLYQQLKPLYQNLHAYVRRKLINQYSAHAQEFPTSRHIPAHILGDMWSQSWTNLFNIMEPYKDKSSVDVTESMQEKHYNATSMFRLAEEFFMSLGFPKMTKSFWDKSMLTKPTDRDTVCHASAWTFDDGEDFRIMQCTRVTMNDLVTAHHEMGHVVYFMAYKDQPLVFQRGANPGFHEAVGDTIALSVNTPDHLHKIGLLTSVKDDYEADINFLMRQALDLVAFLPFGLLVDEWRWSVYRGDTSRDQYNRKWWDLRCKYQGVSPPVERSDMDFDPGAKFHVPAFSSYIGYFVASLLKFQFHQALCKAANNTRPLHKCDIYRSKEAGNKLQEMLSKGSSQPWQDTIEQLTGTRKLDAEPLLEYFRPLTRWLEEQNRGQKVTWQEQCPDGSFSATSAAASMEKLHIWILIVFLYWLT